MQSQVKATSTPTPPVMPVRVGLLQRKCACGGMPGLDGECAECRKKRLGLQRRPVGRSEPSAVPPIVHDVLRSPGQPLGAETRAFMETRFGHDFGKVRMHADAKAAESARVMNALAYTVGQDMVLGAGQYAPRTNEGRKLLAHELTHVVQQSNVASFGLQHADAEDKKEPATDTTAPLTADAGATPTKTDGEQPVSDRAEQEADRVSEQVMQTAKPSSSQPVIARAEAAPVLQRRTVSQEFASVYFETGPIWEVSLKITHAPPGSVDDDEDFQEFEMACHEGIREAIGSIGRVGKPFAEAHPVRLVMRYRRGRDYVNVRNEAYERTRRSILGETATAPRPAPTEGEERAPRTREENRPAGEREVSPEVEAVESKDPTGKTARDEIAEADARRLREESSAVLTRLMLLGIAASVEGSSGEEFQSAVDRFKAELEDRVSALEPGKPIPADLQLVMKALILWSADKGDQWGEGTWDSKDLQMSAPDYATVPASQYKCNAYVAEVLYQSLGVVHLVHESEEQRGKYFPYQAREWENKALDIPHFMIVDQPRMGDIWSKGGHTGIYLGEYSGKKLYISARDDGSGVFGLHSEAQYKHGIQIKYISEGGVYRRYVP